MSYEELEKTAKLYAEKHTMFFSDITLLRIGQKEAFEAGAKWMAGQGVTARVPIDELSCGLYNLCVEAGLTSEDDTIIQVRKLN